MGILNWLTVFEIAQMACHSPPLHDLTIFTNTPLEQSDMAKMSFLPKGTGER